MNINEIMAELAQYTRIVSKKTVLGKETVV